MGTRALIHFKDGQTGTVISGVWAVFDEANDLCKITAGQDPAAFVYALAPLSNVEYVEFLS